MQADCPTCHTADDVADFLFRVPVIGGTFVIAGSDSFQPPPHTFRDIITWSPDGGVFTYFTSSALQRGVGFSRLQTFSCGVADLATYQVTFEFLNEVAMAMKTRQ